MSTHGFTWNKDRNKNPHKEFYSQKYAYEQQKPYTVMG